MFSICSEHRGGIVKENDKYYFKYGNQKVSVTYLGKSIDVYDSLNCRYPFVRITDLGLKQFNVKNVKKKSF